MVTIGLAKVARVISRFEMLSGMCPCKGRHAGPGCTEVLLLCLTAALILVNEMQVEAGRPKAMRQYDSPTSNVRVRRDFSMAAYQDIGFIHGGRNSTSANYIDGALLDVVDLTGFKYYSMTTDISVIGPGILERRFHAMTVWKKYLVVFGGQTAYLLRTADVLYMDIGSTVWTQAADADAVGAPLLNSLDQKLTGCTTVGDSMVLWIPPYLLQDARKGNLFQFNLITKQWTSRVRLTQTTTSGGNMAYMNGLLWMYNRDKDGCQMFGFNTTSLLQYDLAVQGCPTMPTPGTAALMAYNNSLYLWEYGVLKSNWEDVATMASYNVTIGPTKTTANIQLIMAYINNGALSKNSNLPCPQDSVALLQRAADAGITVPPTWTSKRVDILHGAVNVTKFVGLIAGEDAILLHAQAMRRSFQVRLSQISTRSDVPVMIANLFKYTDLPTLSAGKWLYGAAIATFDRCSRDATHVLVKAAFRRGNFEIVGLLGPPASKIPNDTLWMPQRGQFQDPANGNWVDDGTHQGVIQDTTATTESVVKVSSRLFHYPIESIERGLISVPITIAGKTSPAAAVLAYGGQIWDERGGYPMYWYNDGTATLTYQNNASQWVVDTLPTPTGGYFHSPGSLNSPAVTLVPDGGVMLFGGYNKFINDKSSIVFNSLHSLKVLPVTNTTKALRRPFATCSKGWTLVFPIEVGKPVCVEQVLSHGWWYWFHSCRITSWQGPSGLKYIKTLSFDLSYDCKSFDIIVSSPNLKIYDDYGYEVLFKKVTQLDGDYTQYIFDWDPCDMSRINNPRVDAYKDQAFMLQSAEVTATGPKPPERCASAIGYLDPELTAALDPTTKGLILMYGGTSDGGFSSTLSMMDDLWSFNLDTGAWTQIFAEGITPASMQLHRMHVMRGTAPKVIITGGHRYDLVSGNIVNGDQLYVLNLLDLTWAAISTSGLPVIPADLPYQSDNCIVTSTMVKSNIYVMACQELYTVPTAKTSTAQTSEGFSLALPFMTDGDTISYEPPSDDAMMFLSQPINLAASLSVTAKPQPFHNGSAALERVVAVCSDGGQGAFVIRSQGTSLHNMEIRDCIGSGVLVDIPGTELLDATVVLDNLLFTNVTGAAGAAVNIQAPHAVTLQNSLLINNPGSNQTALVLVNSTSEVHIVNTRFEGTGQGSAIEARFATVHLKSVEMVNNQGSMGAGMRLRDFAVAQVDGLTAEYNKARRGGVIIVEATADLKVTNSEFKYNNADEGGAIFVMPSACMSTLSNTLFHKNEAEVSGGALILSQYQCVPSLTNVTFTNNSVLSETGQGGALVLGVPYGRGCEMYEVQMTNNYASAGGAISLFCQYGYLSIDRSNFGGNFARTTGGAMHIQGVETQIQITGTSFSNNTAVRGGAAIYDIATGYLKLLDGNHFEGNVATLGPGGGVSTAAGVHLKINNSSFVENWSKEQGGSVYVFESESTVVQNCWFEGNKASSGAGVYAEYVRQAMLFENSTYRGNSAEDAASDITPITPYLGGGAMVLRLEEYGALVSNCSFVGNSALNGGALLIIHDHPCSLDNPLCEAFVYGCTFTGNMAMKGAGASVMVSDARSVVFSCQRAAQPMVYFNQWPDIKTPVTNTASNVSAILSQHQKPWQECAGSWTMNTATSTGGYGDDVASSAERLSIYTVKSAPEDLMLTQFDDTLPTTTQVNRRLLERSNTTVYLASNSPFSMDVFVLDGYDSIIKSGILDASARIDMVLLPGYEGAATLSGTMQATGLQGKAVLPSLRLLADAGQYIMRVTAYVDGQPAAEVDVPVVVRGCYYGEYYFQQRCVWCDPGRYSFDKLQCKNCPAAAVCNRGSIVPEKLHWHSHPRSSQVHGCHTEKSCVPDTAYLQWWQYAHAGIPTDKLDKDQVLQYLNAQCALGYRGPLCSKCIKGYGRFKMACRQCPSAATTVMQYCAVQALAVVVFAVAAYSQLNANSTPPDVMEVAQHDSARAASKTKHTGKPTTAWSGSSPGSKPSSQGSSIEKLETMSVEDVDDLQTAVPESTKVAARQNVARLKAANEQEVVSSVKTKAKQIKWTDGLQDSRPLPGAAEAFAHNSVQLLHAETGDMPRQEEWHVQDFEGLEPLLPAALQPSVGVPGKQATAHIQTAAQSTQRADMQQQVEYNHAFVHPRSPPYARPRSTQHEQVDMLPGTPALAATTASALWTGGRPVGEAEEAAKQPEDGAEEVATAVAQLRTRSLSIALRQISRVAGVAGSMVRDASRTLQKLSGQDEETPSFEQITIVMKLAVTYSQLLGVILSTPFVHWPETVTSLVKALDFTNFIKNWVSLECTIADDGPMPKSAVRSVTNVLASPAYVFTAATIAWLVLAWWKSRQDQNFDWREYLKTHAQMSLGLVLFQYYPGITTELLTFFNCPRVDYPVDSNTRPGEAAWAVGRWWFNDLEMKCYTGVHSLLAFGFAMPLLLVFSLGLPIMIILWMTENKVILYSPNIRMLLGFFYQGYADHCYWWEAVMLLFKLIMVTLYVSLKDVLRPAVLVALELAIMTLGQLVTTHVQPFQERFFNILTVLSFHSLQIASVMVLLLTTVTQEWIKLLGTFVLVSTCTLVTVLYIYYVGHSLLYNVWLLVLEARLKYKSQRAGRSR